MSAVEHMIQGFAVALTPANLLASLIGVIIGTLVGVLPGLGPTGAMAIMLPLTIQYGPLTGLILMAGIWYGSQYGGSTTSILVNIPGEASSVVTCLDGYAMAKKGRAGAALAVAAVGSFIAGTLGLIGLQFFAPLLARAALAFGPPEYLAVMLFALVALTTLTGESPLKGVMMIGFGVLLSTIGIDRVSGTERFTMGFSNLMAGIEFVPVAIGLFGLSEVLQLSLNPYQPPTLISVRFRELYPNREECRRSLWPILRGSVLGFLFGLLPGTPAVLSSFSSYSLEKALSPRKVEFGNGAIEGVAGPESANNSAVVAGLIPLLTLGIPFAPVAAILLAGLEMHNVKPGPLLFTQQPDLFWGFIAAMYLANVLLVILNLPLVGLFAKIATLPPRILMPIIGVLCLMGAYTTRMSFFDIWVALGAGVAGFILRRSGYPIIPLVIGMVLGNMLEDSWRVTYQLFKGDIVQLFFRPISMGVLVLIPLYLLVIAFASKRGLTREAAD